MIKVITSLTSIAPLGQIPRSHNVLEAGIIIVRERLRLVLAGVVGPPLFVLAFTVLGQFTPGYSPASQVISDLELVQNGWIQQLNFLQCGASIVVFALGLRKEMLGAVRRLRLATTLLVFSGAGMIDASFFTPAFPIEHTLGFLFFIVPLTAAIFLLGRQFLVGRLRNLGAYSLSSGSVTLILLLYFFFQGASAPISTTPTGLIGVVNRLFVVAALSWFVVTGAALLKNPRSKASS